MKIRKIRLFLIIFWFILAGLVAWFKIVPFGHVTYSKNYPERFSLLGGKGFIGKFSPAERISSTTPNSLIGDPVYFSIFTPRTFDKVKLTIIYKPNLSDKTPIIEAGVLVDNVVWRYKMAPLQNDIIDNNLKDWYRVREGDTILLQKEKTFSDVKSFVSALDNGFKNYCDQPSSCLAWYNADNLSSHLALAKINKTTVFKPITIPLQGAHQFYFLNDKKGPANFSLDFSDLNLNRDADNVEISIYHDSEKIYSQLITDNFGGESNGQVREFASNFQVDFPGLGSNIYKLEIKANDDIVIKKINEAPGALNVISRLHPVASPEKSLSFWTDSSYLQVSAVGPASLQKIIFGDKTFSLDEAYKQFEFSNTKTGLKEVRLNKDDVILENTGIFSFNSNDFFNPNLQQIDRHFAVDNNLKFVLANYQKPLNLEDGYKQATVTLETKVAYREKGKYGFVISVPGLSLAQSGSLEIKSIKAEFSGRTIFDKIFELFGAL